MTTSKFLALTLAASHSENVNLELRHFVALLYGHLHEIELADGCRIQDATDLREFCREVYLHLEGMKQGRKVV